MKKTIYLIAVVMLLFSCKKETTTPTPVTTTSDIERIQMVTCTSADAPIDSIKYEYLNDGRISSMHLFSHQKKADLSGDSLIIMNQFFQWSNNQLIIKQDGNDVNYTMNVNGLCSKADFISLKYDSLNQLSQFGIVKGEKLEGYVFEKDTFVTCVWQNSNLISVGSIAYEYYETDNNSFNLFPSIAYGYDSNQTKIQLFGFDPFTIEFGGSFCKGIFGKPTKKLMKRMILEKDNSYLFEYKLDTFGRVIEMKLINEQDNSSVTFNYKWSK